MSSWRLLFSWLVFLLLLTSGRNARADEIDQQLWRGEFGQALALAKKDPAQIGLLPALEHFVSASKLMAKKQFGAARSYFWKAKSEEKLKVVAAYWGCMTYKLGRLPLQAEDCFKDEKMDPDIATKMISKAPKKSGVTNIGGETIGAPCSQGSTQCMDGREFQCVFEPNLGGPPIYYWSPTGNTC